MMQIESTYTGRTYKSVTYSGAEGQSDMAVFQSAMSDLGEDQFSIFGKHIFWNSEDEGYVKVVLYID